MALRHSRGFVVGVLSAVVSLMATGSVPAQAQSLSAGQAARSGVRSLHGADSPPAGGTKLITVTPFARRFSAGPAGAKPAARRAAPAVAGSTSPPFNECPAIGADSSCGILLIVGDQGNQVIADPSQGPFDGIEDTLIGVVNQSSTALTSVALSSNTDLFGFDGDGLCNVGAAPSGCPFGPTGYEGPGTRFTGISPDHSGGFVEFIGGLAAGQSTFFSLEEALNQSTVVLGGPSIFEQGGPDNPSEDPTTCSDGEPVNCATGEFWHSFEDVRVPGRGMPLDFVRTYTSSTTPSDGPLGFGWTSSYAMSLAFGGAGAVTVNQENGSTVTFSPNGFGGFIAPPRVLATLVHNGDGSYTFTRVHGQIRFNFSAAGQLISEVDRNGYATTLSYSGSQLTAVTDPSGRALTFTYTGTHISAITDPAGQSSTFGYDAAGNLTSANSAVQGAWAFTYDAAHLLLTMTDPRGGTVATTYDPQSRVTRQSDPLGRATTWAYAGNTASAAGGTTTMTDPRGTMTTYQYQNLELLVETSAAGTPIAAVTSYSYDPATLGRTSVTDPNGGISTYTFDSRGNVLSAVDPLGNSSFYSYDGVNDPATITDPSGTTTVMTYDGNGNPSTISRPLSGTAAHATEALTYGDAAHPGDVTAFTDPDGGITRRAYDAAGDLAQEIDPVGDTTGYAYDVLGRRTTTVSPRGNTAHFTYNAANQVVSTTDALNHVTRNSYDLNHNLATQTDPSGLVTTHTYDSANEITSVTRPDHTVLRYAYDASSNTTAQTDGAAHNTAYAYDALNRMTSTVDPLGRSSSYTYDRNGNRTAQIDPAGLRTTFSYDAGNHLLSTSYSDGTTPSVTDTYDALGQRTTMADGTGTSTYSYDSLRRLTSTTDGAGSTVSYAYNLRGQPTSITYPGTGHVVTRGYDPAGHLTRVGDWTGHTTTFGFDPDGDVSTQAFGDGTAATSHFNAAGHLTDITHTSAAGTLASFAYGRTASSLVASEVGTGTPGGSQTYSYDSLNQLASTSAGTYAYDAANNVTHTPTVALQSYDAANQLTSGGITTVGTATGKDLLGLSTGTTIALPNGVAPGDQIVVSSVQTTGSSVGVAGYTAVGAASSGSGGTTSVFRRTAAGNETSVTLTYPFLVPRVVIVSVYRGVDPTSPLDGVATGGTKVGSTITTPSITTTQAGDRLVQFQGANTLLAGTWAAPTGMTETVQVSNLILRDGGMAEQNLGAAGPTGSRTAAFSSIAPLGLSAVMLALRPAPKFAYNTRGDRVTTTAPSGASIALTYDQASRLTGYGTGATYAYNGDGLRTSKTVNAARENFVWDAASGSTPLMLMDGSVSYVYGPSGMPLEQIDAAGHPLFYHLDQLGSVRVITDAAAKVVATQTFDPYGRKVGSTGTATTPLGFAGEYTDAESGFVYLRARYFDPSTAQFLTVDPAFALTGSRYGYATNSPLNFVDPSGRCNCDELLAKITDQSSMIEGKADAMVNNPGNLPTFGPSMTWESHIAPFLGYQKYLIKLINEWTANCGTLEDLPESVLDHATQPVPEPANPLYSVPQPQPGPASNPGWQLPSIPAPSPQAVATGGALVVVGGALLWLAANPEVFLLLAL